MTAATLQRRASALGCTVSILKDSFGTAHEVLVDAPAGSIFVGSGCHQNVSAGSDGEPLASLIQDAYDRLELGVESCEDPDCDVCKNS